MIPPSAVILDRDLKSDIQMVFERQSRLQRLKPNSRHYLIATNELELLYREIGWQLIWNLEESLR